MLLLGPDFYADSQKSVYTRLFAILLAQMHMDRPELSKCSWGKKQQQKKDMFNTQGSF